MRAGWRRSCDPTQQWPRGHTGVMWPLVALAIPAVASSAPYINYVDAHGSRLRPPMTSQGHSVVT